MRAAVKRDRTTRTIQITVESGSVPDVDVTRRHHRKPRIFRPDSVTIRVVDGEIGLVRASGGLVLKSGGTSTEIQEKEEWNAGIWSSERKLADAPEWLALLIADAPHGVTSWCTGADAGEVQAL